MINMDELHSFTVGFFEVLCPWKPRYDELLPMPKYLEKEVHYYLAGRGAGFIALLCVIIVFSLIMKEVL